MDPIRPINPNEPQFTILPALPIRRVSPEERRPQDEDGDSSGPDREHPGPDDDATDEWEDGGPSARDDQDGAVPEPIIELDVYDERGHEHHRIVSGLDLYEVPRTTPTADATKPNPDARAPAADRLGAGVNSDDVPSTGSDGDDPPVRHIDISA